MTPSETEGDERALVKRRAKESGCRQRATVVEVRGQEPWMDEGPSSEREIGRVQQVQDDQIRLHGRVEGMVMRTKQVKELCGVRTFAGKA